MRTFNINGSTVQTVDVMSKPRSYLKANAHFGPSRDPKWVLMFYSTIRCVCQVRLVRALACVRTILYNERCDAKPPDVKSQIIRPRFPTAFISLPNLDLLRGFKL